MKQTKAYAMIVLLIALNFYQFGLIRERNMEQTQHDELLRNVSDRLDEQTEVKLAQSEQKSDDPYPHLGTMVIPEITKFGIKKRPNGEFVEIRETSDVTKIVFHHFGFVPKDLHIKDLSKSELRNAYYHGYTSHLVQYADDDDLRDTFVPYHYIIYQDAEDNKIKYRKVLETETMCSAHDGLSDGTQYKCNSISVAIAGDYRDSPYEDELVEVMLDLTYKLASYFPIDDVLGHKDIDATACPGKYWDDMRPILVAALPEERRIVKEKRNIYKYATRFGTPEEILSAIHCAETFNTKTGQCHRSTNSPTSSAGAKGCMQFLPKTFEAYGVDGDGDGIADIDNCADSIASASNYLFQNYSKAKKIGMKNEEAWRHAFFRYNQHDWYVNRVVAILKEEPFAKDIRFL
jgi:hypothetical protein